MITQVNRVDRMQEKTWSWLDVNTAQLHLYAQDEKREKGIRVEAPDGIEIIQDFSEVSFPKAAEGFLTDQNSNRFFEEHSKLRYYIRIPEQYRGEAPVRIIFEAEEEGCVIDEDIVIEAQEKSEASVIFQYRSKNENVCFHSGRTRVLVRENASLKLVKVQLFNDGTAHHDTVQGIVEKKGSLSLVQAEMGSAGAAAGWNVLLAGEESQADLDILYLGEKEKKLDFTSRVELRGQKTGSRVRAKGILLGKSKKIFRDTLDFISGAKGAAGREEEDVLMLADTVRNISVPLLFCGEDDVQGEHAATSGRPNESILFYLMSRGLSDADARMLLAESKFAAALDKMDDKALKEEIVTFLRKSIERDGYDNG